MAEARRTASSSSSSSPMTDVVVIGAGIIGSCTALELRRANPTRRVTVVDSNAFAGAGTTSFSSGIIRTFYSVPETTACAWESFLIWNHWEDYICQGGGVPRRDPRGMASMRKVPGLILRSPNSAAFLDGFLAQAKVCGIRAEELDYATTKVLGERAGWDVSKSFSPVRIDDPDFGNPVAGQRIEGAVAVPDTGYVSDPQLATKNVQFAAEALGVEFKYSALVTDILTETTTGASSVKGHRRVEGVRFQDGTQLLAPIVINAAGPASSRVTQLAFPHQQENDMTVTTRPLRAECAVVDAPPGINLDVDGVVSFDFDLGVYFRPEFGNRLLIGGLDLPCDDMDWVAPDALRDMSTSFTHQWKSHVYRMALRMPTLGIPQGKGVRGVVSTYDVTEDWSPIVDGSALPGYFMAIGSSGNCFKIAPFLGHLMAAVVDGQASVDLHRSKLGRFSTSVFSRSRRPFLITGGVAG